MKHLNPLLTQFSTSNAQKKLDLSHMQKKQNKNKFNSLKMYKKKINYYQIHKKMKISREELSIWKRK